MAGEADPVPGGDSGLWPKEARRVVLGRISGLFGIKGWVKIHSDTDPRSNILNYPSWYLMNGGEWREYQIRNGRPQGRSVVASLEGVDDRDQAAGLVGAEIAVPREQLPDADPDEYYWTDLEGLVVVNLQGVQLGRVERLFPTGSNDVMVVAGDRERLVPFSEGVVVEVDLQQGRITVDWDPDF